MNVCPLCQKANACAMAQDKKAAGKTECSQHNDCWCMAAVIPAELLASVDKHAACICQQCVKNFTLNAAKPATPDSPK